MRATQESNPGEPSKSAIWKGDPREQSGRAIQQSKPEEHPREPPKRAITQESYTGEQYGRATAT